MYSIREYSTQTIFQLDTESGEAQLSKTKTKEEIDKEFGFRK
jgi:hypothetical protein